MPRQRPIDHKAEKWPEGARLAVRRRCRRGYADCSTRFSTPGHSLATNTSARRLLARPKVAVRFYRPDPTKIVRLAVEYPQDGFLETAFG